ncbi:hypothetical protein [uncultured Chryseobacterium sp.]|uniref:hypothetical protein n=1 Tax=uncultured Chryseobacterium sp. TaxID=259322 RepID=UPI00258391AA|nr:hypothetical protein [uncultured Chryseobacterium sp.]
MKQTIGFLIFFMSIILSAQNLTLSDKELKKKLDSIKTEGNLLYTYENASWHAGDIVGSNKRLAENTGSYITYQKNDTIKTSFLNKVGNMVIAELSFKNNQTKPVKENFKERVINETETTLKNIRSTIIPQLSDPKYAVTVPQGYSLNMIIIPFNENYKVYLIPGTAQSGVIPFGNDYLFVSDKEGNIISHKKFHSRLIPTSTVLENGGTVTMSTHSHLATNPFISATDICTFKLYAPLTTLDEFSVLSTALGTYIKYNYKKDNIEVVKKP